MTRARPPHQSFLLPLPPPLLSSHLHPLSLPLPHPLPLPLPPRPPSLSCSCKSAPFAWSSPPLWASNSASRKERFKRCCPLIHPPLDGTMMRRWMTVMPPPNLTTALSSLKTQTKSAISKLLCRRNCLLQIELLSLVLLLLLQRHPQHILPPNRTRVLLPCEPRRS